MYVSICVYVCIHRSLDYNTYLDLDRVLSAQVLCHIIMHTMSHHHSYKAYLTLEVDLDRNLTHI